MIYKKKNNELYVFESEEEFKNMNDYVNSFNPRAFKDTKEFEVTVQRWNKKYKRFIKEKIKVPLTK